MRTVLSGVFALAVLSAPCVGGAAPAHAPRADEMALLAFANMARAESNLPPLVWNDGLGEAARWKSDDEIAHSCNRHDSCNGEAWWRRIQRFYPGWFALGENIAGSVGIPRRTHDNWMGSASHRANILGPYTEFGAGVSVGGSASGNREHSTEDFGDRGAITSSSIPTVPAAGVSPRRGWSGSPRELVVNYYDRDGGPRSVRALVGTSCVTLPRIAGSATNGTYGIQRSFTAPCTPVVFEVIRSDGTRHRWPASGAVQVAVDYATCAEFTTAAPGQDCGGGGAPQPTPVPTPGGSTTDLDSVRIALNPSRTDPSAVQVRIEATLPAIPGFAPDAAAIALDLDLGDSAGWSRTLPRDCGAARCLEPNARGTAYRGSYGAGAKLSLVRTRDGRWKLRFASPHESLPEVLAGPVTLSITAGGSTFVGLANGELRERGLIAR